MMRVAKGRHSPRARSLNVLMITLFLSHSGELIAATQEEIDEWLEAHNSYRQLHGAAALVWSVELAASAQVYAGTCSSSHSGSGYGENLAWASYDMGRRAVVKMWYDEAPRYDFSNPGFESATGHFTQLLWKGTMEIGCGHVGSCTKEGSGMENFWVCHYNPPGNYRGEFPENVLPGIALSTDD